MDYCIRLMRKEDVRQVSEIDHEAFPGWFPLTNYEHELENTMAHFIVAYEEVLGDRKSQELESGEKRGVASRLMGFLSRNQKGEVKPTDRILGFAGFWVMAGEAHVMSIAVREAYRRQGIGELLMLSIIEMAIGLKADVVSLECRVSNYGAQDLYKKLGFKQVGVRYGYYSDNREDAYVMTTDEIQTAPFQSHLKKLKKFYTQRWGNRFRETLIA